jgi:hypothetical protein
MAAELATTDNSHDLDHFVVRFGNADRLKREGLIKADFAAPVFTPDGAFRVHIGGSASESEADPVNWAFELTKIMERNDLVAANPRETK